MSEPIHEPRLGYTTGAGAHFPDVDVNGRPYSRPASTQGIGGVYFVVLPMGQRYDESLAALKALIPPPAQPEARQETAQHGSSKRNQPDARDSGRNTGAAEQPAGDERA